MDNQWEIIKHPIELNNLAYKYMILQKMRELRDLKYSVKNKSKHQNEYLDNTLNIPLIKEKIKEGRLMKLVRYLKRSINNNFVAMKPLMTTKTTTTKYCYCRVFY